MCDKKWILYDNQRWPPHWLDWEAPKHLAKPNLNEKKVMVTVWWSAARLIHFSFLNSGETLHLKSLLSKLMRKLRWLQLVLVNRMGPILHNKDRQHIIQPMLKSWMNWAMKFCLICHIHMTSCQLSLLQASRQLFAGKILPQPAGGRKHFPRVPRIPKYRFLRYRNKQTSFLLAKMCWL